MARFMVKASEYKNVCKAVNDRKLEELKKEMIEILKKQDEREFKKAVDYLNSQEFHYTHLEKSITGKWIEKAGYGIGTVRTWKGKKYKKVAQGKWVRVFDKEGHGTNVAIGKLISKIQKCDNVEDLMALVMANKSRFVDENGVDLPILDKLRAAADIRNEKLSGESSSYTYGVGENTSREKNEIFAGKDKITKEEAKLHKVARKISQMPTGELNKRKAQLERWIDNKTKSKRDHLNNTIWREKYQEELDAINDVLDKRGVKKTEKVAENQAFTNEELDKLKSKGYSVENLRKKGYSDEEIKEMAKDKPKMDRNELITKIRSSYSEMPEDQIDKDIKYLRNQKKSDSSMTVSIAGSERMPIDDAINILKECKKLLEEAEKHQNNSDAMKGNQNAYKGVYEPSESTNIETKKAIAENKKIGENEVQMPYSKELGNEMKTLKNCVSKDPNREFMNHVYYDNGNLIATDGKRLKTVKVGELDGIENGSYVDINVSKDGIDIKRMEGMDDKRFPNYARVIPDDLSQKITLKNDVIKEKIKELKKDGAIDKKIKKVQLEIKDGKLYLDDTEIGDAQGVNLKYSNDWGDTSNDTNFININSDYLVNALNGDNSILMLGDRADKAVGINTDSTTNIIMPMQGSNEKMDYSENKVRKSLSDGLLGLGFIEDDELEDEIDEQKEEDEENFTGTDYNDYSAEQPELFNSTGLIVEEAFNRHCNCN